jgi:predicted RecA/RadA family phage recombinase
MPTVSPFYDAGQDITVSASAGLTGGRCVGLPTGRNPGGPAGISDIGDGLLICGLPTLNGEVYGVAAYDCPSGGRTEVMKAPKHVPIECNAAVAQGSLVSVNADGTVKVAATGQVAVGRHHGPATTAPGQYCQVEMFLGRILAP